MNKVKLENFGIEFIVPMRDKPKKFEGNIPWCRIEDIEGKYLNGTKSNKYVSEQIVEQMNLKVLPKNSLIFSCSATIGVVAINTVPLCTNQTFIGMTSSDKLDINYLFYHLKLYGESLKKIASQTTIPYISKEKFQQLEIFSRDIKTQQKIASVLSSLDDKIELNNKINTELEAIAKTLYDYWFVQFEFPNAEGKPYKSSGGKMLFNEILKREIPEGWEVKNIKEIADIVDCLHSKKPNFSLEDSNFYLAQLENVLDNGQFNNSYKYFVSKMDYNIWTSRIEVKENDILVTNAGRVGANCQIPEGVYCGIGRNITAIRPKDIFPTYFHLAFRGFDIQKQIKLNTDQGAFFQSLNVKGIKMLNFLIPELNILNDFESFVSSIRKKRDHLLKQNQELATLRDWLLPMLMNGQVKVE